MRKAHFFTNLISVLLVLCCAFAVGTLTAFADPEDGDAVSSEEYVESQLGPEEDPQVNPPTEPGEDPGDHPQDDPSVEAPTQEPTEDFLGGWIEPTSAYEEPEDLQYLPEAQPEEVPLATAVTVPEVTVSDATLFSGIVMWLCVALGIAVIVGVLVSKRTHRRGD